MPQLNAKNHTFHVQGVVLDKDGTLSDLNQAWGPRTVTWIELLARSADGRPELAPAIFDLIGYDPAGMKALADGPFISANESKLVTLAAGVLYQAGIPWVKAEEAALATIREAYSAPLTTADILPLGDVAGTVRGWREAGVAIAIATADSRDTTEQSLALLGIDGEIDLVMCGDDALPQKPDAAVMAWIAEQFGCAPGELLMVGDTVTDMLTGRNGGAAGTVAIVPDGLAASDNLRRHADVVLRSIDELTIVT
jgi:phosphoglycolate phosphatase